MKLAASLGFGLAYGMIASLAILLAVTNATLEAQNRVLHMRVQKLEREIRQNAKEVLQKPRDQVIPRIPASVLSAGLQEDE